MSWKRILSLALLLAVGCGARSTDDWLQQLNDAEVVKRREAIRELGARRLEAAQVVPALVKALRDQNGYVRHDAAAALGKFGPEAQAAVSDLVAALGDKEKSVRTAAAAALKRIDPPAAAKAGVR
jgi:HEAT repeat protein